MASAAPLLLRRPLVLAIETSCDDSSVAVVSACRRIVAHATRHQSDLHLAYGGIAPLAACRAHSRNLPLCIADVVRETALKTGAWREGAAAEALPSLARLVDAVAVTRGPGLPSSLAAGVSAATALAAASGLPIYAVHHLAAHALTPRLCASASAAAAQDAPPAFGETRPFPAFPYLTVLASGGNTMIARTRGPACHEVLGETADDAIGEAFDKIARLLGAGWGAGLEKLACEHDAKPPVERARLENLLLLRKFSAPSSQDAKKIEKIFSDPELRSALVSRDVRRYGLSFSGLKTAARMLVARFGTLNSTENYPKNIKMAATAEASVPRNVAAAIARAFVNACCDHVGIRLRRILHDGAAGGGFTCVVLSGGVAANETLRRSLRRIAEDEFGLPLIIPPHELCTDNAAMIAWAAIERMTCDDDNWAAKLRSPDAMGFDILPKWTLPELAQHYETPESKDISENCKV